MRIEAVNKLAIAQTTMALSCVLVVQAILWLMMILAVMVNNCDHIIFLLTMLICFVFKIWMSVLKTLMSVLRHVLTTMALSCVLVIRDSF